MINEASNELVLFGGLGDGPPFPPTPMSHNVYTSRLMAVDEARTHERLKALRQDFIDPKIAEHHGRVAKLMGDGALVEFARAWCARRLPAARPGPFLFRKGE